MRRSLTGLRLGLLKGTGGYARRKNTLDSLKKEKKNQTTPHDFYSLLLNEAQMYCVLLMAVISLTILEH